MIYKNTNPFNGGKIMEGIFDYQGRLMKIYASKNAIPKLPIDINNREHQRFIKYTIGDIIEELVEADSAYDPVKFSMCQDNLMELRGKLNEHFINYSDELADAMHFFVELLISVGIDNDEMLDYFGVKAKEENIEAILTQDAMTTSLRYARHLLIRDTPIMQLKQRSMRALNKMQYEQLHVGGYFLNPELIAFFYEFNWEITKNLKSAAHLLKKKAWRESDIKTELRPFYEFIMKAWIFFMCLYDLAGMDEKSIYTRYENKNIINQQRAQSSY